MFTRFQSVTISSLLALCLLPASALGQIIIKRGSPPVGSAARPATDSGFPASSTDPFSHADALRKEGNNREALLEITEAIRFDTDCGKCFSLRAAIEGNLGEYYKGIGDADIGVKRSTTDHDKAVAAYNLGFNLSGLGRDSEAQVAYNDSIRFDPTFEMAYFGKGKTLWGLGSWGESKTALEKALQLNPKHGAAWAYLAEDQMAFGDAKAGLVSANRAVELASTDARGYRARAIADYWNENFEAMLADATRVLDIDPTRKHGHLFRGHALKLLGREAEAADEYALESDRAAVKAGMVPPRPADLRAYNCGDYSTEIQTPANFNTSSFDDCLRRIHDALEESTETDKPTPNQKRVVPGLPAKQSVKK